MRHTKRTLDFAAQLKASVMVTHLGSVGFFWTNSGSKLKQWVRTHSDAKVRENPAYRKLLTKS